MSRYDSSLYYANWVWWDNYQIVHYFVKKSIRRWFSLRSFEANQPRSFTFNQIGYDLVLLYCTNRGLVPKTCSLQLYSFQTVLSTSDQVLRAEWRTPSYCILCKVPRNHCVEQPRMAQPSVRSSKTSKLCTTPASKKFPWLSKKHQSTGVHHPSQTKTWVCCNSVEPPYEGGSRHPGKSEQKSVKNDLQQGMERAERQPNRTPKPTWVAHIEWSMSPAKTCTAI